MSKSNAIKASQTSWPRGATGVVCHRIRPLKGLSPGEWRPDTQPKSSVLPARYSEIMALMNDLETECGEKDWDGMGALPINRESLSRAVYFLLMHLPDDIPLPDIGCEPSGRVSAEWFGKHCNAAMAFKADKTFLIGEYNKTRPDVFLKTADAEEAVKIIRALLY